MLLFAEYYSVIEKILENLEDSNLSDLENSESEEILEDLFEAFDNNEIFVMEELSRQGPYDISITNINGECNDELVLDENGSSSEAGTSNYQPKQVNEFRWKKTSWAPPQAEFSECYSSNAVKLPVQYFLEYFTVEFFEEVVQATNQASLLKDGRSFNLTKEEFFKFLALEVMIGTIGYPRLSMYWTAPTDIPAFRQNMTKNRFHSLRNNLKFTTSDPGNDKLFRIRPLINIFTKKLYTIPKEENLCVDEMMVPFKGKTVLRQYMPKKPIKWGIKLFCLCSSNGMLYDFEIYQGKNTVISGPKLGFCSDIVVHLTRTIPENKNFKLFFDNYFSTLNLILYLQKKGIWATGTIRGNRCSKVPLQSEKELKKEGRGSFDYRIEREDNLYVIRWLDGGVVQLI